MESDEQASRAFSARMCRRFCSLEGAVRSARSPVAAGTGDDAARAGASSRNRSLARNRWTTPLTRPGSPRLLASAADGPCGPEQERQWLSIAGAHAPSGARRGASSPGWRARRRAGRRWRASASPAAPRGMTGRELWAAAVRILPFPCSRGCHRLRSAGSMGAFYNLHGARHLAGSLMA